MASQGYTCEPALSQPRRYHKRSAMLGIIPVHVLRATCMHIVWLGRWAWGSPTVEVPQQLAGCGNLGVWTPDPSGILGAGVLRGTLRNTPGLRLPPMIAAPHVQVRLADHTMCCCVLCIGQNTDSHPMLRRWQSWHHHTAIMMSTDDTQRP